MSSRSSTTASWSASSTTRPSFGSSSPRRTPSEGCRMSSAATHQAPLALPWHADRPSRHRSQVEPLAVARSSSPGSCSGRSRADTRPRPRWRQSTTSVHNSLNRAPATSRPEPSWFMQYAAIASPSTGQSRSSRTWFGAAFPRPLPAIGWLGVIALGAWVAWHSQAGRSRSSPCVSSHGVRRARLLVRQHGPAHHHAGSSCSSALSSVSRWRSGWLTANVNALVTPVLDVLQTLPVFVYLLPLSLSSGSVRRRHPATLIYALPPVVRIASLGMRVVSPTDLRGHLLARPDHGQRIRRLSCPWQAAQSSSGSTRR